MTHPVGSASFDHGGSSIVVHLVDGTYELFRHFYGQRRFNKGQDKPFGAVLLHRPPSSPSIVLHAKAGAGSRLNR